jgi:uncharacterized protein (DUF58 family)
MAAGTPAAATSRLKQQAEQIASLLPPLLVAAERIAVTVAQGVHGRRRVGTGDAFWQFRRYQSGDAAATIDWRQSAKRQNYFVRQNEWEAAESVWLWRDESPSMNWRSQWAATTKLERATLLLLAVAALLLRGGERVALLAQDRVPMSGQMALQRLAQSLALPRAELAAPAASLPPAVELPRYAQVVLIGDFLSPLVEVEAAVRGLASSGVKGHILQIIDPAEAALPFHGRARFHGLEGESAYTVSRVETLHDSWERRIARRQADLADIARRASWSFALHHTDRSAQSALLALYGALSGERIGR